MSEPVRVGSLFAGVGGFDLGFARAGMATSWLVENDKQCQSVLRKRFPNARVYDDVREVASIDAPMEPSGPRCVADPICDRSSINGGHARPRSGRDMEHGTYAEVREVGAADSELLVRGIRDEVEREPGCRNGRELLNGGTCGKTNTRRRTLEPVSLICGGFPCQDYSVAGKRGGLAGDRGALWWEMHRIIADLQPTWVVGENVPGLLSSNGGRDFLTIVASLVQLGYGVIWATLDSRYCGVAQRRRRLFIVGHSGGEPRPEILALSEGLYGHPAPSREAGEDVAGSIGGRASGEGGFRQDLDNAPAVANTVPNKYRGDPHEGTDTIIGAVPRRLTPLECERLQGFPDHWTRVEHSGKPMADGPRYRMMGNAVTVNVIEWIGRRIMAAEAKEEAEDE